METALYVFTSDTHTHKQIFNVLKLKGYALGSLRIYQKRFVDAELIEKKKEAKGSREKLCLS